MTTSLSDIEESLKLTATAQKMMEVLEKETGNEAGEILVCFGTAMLLYAASRGLSREQVMMWLRELPMGAPLFDQGGLQ